MRLWIFLIAALIFTPIASSADESTLNFQEQVGEWSTYNWRVSVEVPAGQMCVVTVVVFDKDGRVLTASVGPLLVATAIFNQTVTVPAQQTSLWSRMHTSKACG